MSAVIQWRGCHTVTLYRRAASGRPVPGGPVWCNVPARPCAFRSFSRPIKVVFRALQRAGAFRYSLGVLTIAVTRAPPWARGAGPVLSRVRPKYTPRTMKSQPFFSDFFEKIFIPYTIIYTHAKKIFSIGGIWPQGRSWGSGEKRDRERLREIERD